MIEKISMECFTDEEFQSRITIKRLGEYVGKSVILMGWRGSLCAIGVQFEDQGALAAKQLARVLSGESPAELPVLRPERFHVSFNLKSAKSLGVAIPSSLLDLADEVIK